MNHRLARRGQSALDRIAARDPRLGAFQVVRATAALAEAQALDQRPDRSHLPLAGVPVAIKDNVAVAGEPMRDGSTATPSGPQPVDHPVVQRLRDAGAVVVGITRSPELCVFGATDSAFGITRNPWDLTRSPGGSSGGSAAAVCAALVPVAHANDGMGSIRIPAACCGLVGIKPGTGVVPAALGANDWYGMAENGPLATTVQDAALMLSVLADDERLAVVQEPAGSLRIAVSTRSPVLGVRPDVEHVRAVVRAVRDLEASGHRVERTDPPYPVNPLPLLARWFAGAARDAEGLDPQLLDRAVRTHAAIGERLIRRGYPKDTQRDELRARMAEFFQRADVLLTPTLAAPPLPAVRWGQRPWWRVFAANARYAPTRPPGTWLATRPCRCPPASIHALVRRSPCSSSPRRAASPCCWDWPRCSNGARPGPGERPASSPPTSPRAPTSATPCA